jgi:hypothetical protein
MKKTIFLFSIALIAISAAAQTKQHPNGIGKLKLGSSIDLVKDLGFDVIPINDYSQSFAKPNRIYEFISDTNSVGQATIYGKPDPRVRVFKVPLINIADGIDIKNSILTFMNDTLISVNCEYNGKVNEALDVKYGKSETVVKEEPHKFTRTYTGEEITLIDVTYTNDWGDGNIECTSMLKKYYSGSIEAKYLSYFCILNKKAIEDINKVSLEFSKRAKKRLADDKKKSLSDF